MHLQLLSFHFCDAQSSFHALMEKILTEFDREALWTALRLYGLSGRLLTGLKSFYVNIRSCVRKATVGVVFLDNFMFI